MRHAWRRNGSVSYASTEPFRMERCGYRIGSSGSNRVAGVAVPGRFLFARTRGLLGRGTAESPSPRDHRDLLLRGDPAKKRLSAPMAIPVLTIGDDSWSFCDNQSPGSFRMHPRWVVGVSVRPPLSEPDLGVGRSRAVSVWRARGRLRSSGAGPRFAQTSRHDPLSSNAGSECHRLEPIH